MQGVEKASLGTRYLLKYLENKKPVYFDVVKNCISEVRFWALVMHFCNNMDDLFKELPDEIIAKVFKSEKIAKVIDVLDGSKSVVYQYGTGYHSSIIENYRTQIRLIRNCLAHGNFSFDGEKISVQNPSLDFWATFDIKWFEALVLSLLSNHMMKKGITDYSIIATESLEGKAVSEMLALNNTGSLNLIKITCVADNPKAVISKFPKLAKVENRINFNQMKTSFIRALYKEIQLKSLEMPPKEAFTNALYLLKRAYAGILDIECIKLDDNLFNDSEFLKLSLKDGCIYLTNKCNKENKVMRNTIDLKSILAILDQIEAGKELTLETEYEFKDYELFLLKLYGYILFSQKFSVYHQERMQDIFEEYLEYLNQHYVHAHNVWKEYIKKISKSVDALMLSNASSRGIELWKERLKMYKDRLDRLVNEDINEQTFWNFRNSLTHGLVEEAGDRIIFYGEEPEIMLPKLNSKTKELLLTSFRNKGRTFELNVDKNIYLQMLDRLYEKAGIEISVNIAKYRQRKGYLKS